MFEWNTLIYIVIAVIHRNYSANDALTASIHVVIPVIDQNYNINGIVREKLAKSRELCRNSGHSPELRYQEMISRQRNQANFQRIMSWFRSFTGITMNEANIMK